MHEEGRVAVIKDTNAPCLNSLDLDEVFRKGENTWQRKAQESGRGNGVKTEMRTSQCRGSEGTRGSPWPPELVSARAPRCFVLRAGSPKIHGIKPLTSSDR